MSGVWLAAAATAPLTPGPDTPKAKLKAAVAALNQSNYPRATALAQQAWQQARRQQPPARRWEWEALDFLSEAAELQQQLPQAIAYARQALAVADALGNDTLVTSSSITLGNALSGNHQWREAEPYLLRALAGERRLQEPSGQSHVLVNLTWNVLDQQQPHQLPAARRYADEAVAQARRLGRALTLCNALDAQANVRMAQGERAAAVAAIEEALRVAQASGRMKNILYVRGSLSEIYEKAGRLPQALAAERQYRALQDSLNSADVQRQVADLSTRFGVKQQQDSIASLKQQQRITALSAAQATARARLWGLVAVALAMGLGLGGWLLRQVRRSRAALAATAQELRAANRVKDEANATKDQLMRIVGHDLRAPLATFQQFGPELADLADQPDPAEQRRLATALTDQARAVSDLADNLLSWARAQSGQVQPLIQWNRPALLPQRMERVFGPVAAAKGVKLHVECAPDVPESLLFDADLLGAVLRNLLGNAIKFTPAGGTVRLHITTEPAAPAVLTITDTGRGMTAAQLAAALDGSPVASSAGTNGEPGTGLGLAVCRHFVGLLGAEWRGESLPGPGTRWTIALPRQAAN